MNDSTVEEIEQFITDELEDACFGQGINSKYVLKFLPGHSHMQNH